VLAIHCNCQQLIEVRGDKVTRYQSSGLPLNTVSGLAINSALPISSYVSSALPVSYGYGLNGLNTLGLHNNLGLYNNLGLHNNLGLYNNLGLRSVVSPSVYSVVPKQSLLAVRQPSLAIAQPAISFAQRSVIAQPQIDVALRPQVLTSEAVRPVNAAIQQIGRTVEYKPVPYSDQPIVPQEIVVEPSDQPINIHFRSRSSTIRISHEHIPGEPGTVEQTSSQDEPSKVIHEVVKPVIQEVREVIQPYRQITQEVQPVVENVHRVVAQGEGIREQYVAQPLVKQVIQEVRPAVQTYAVRQPVVSVAQPIQTVVSQPKIAAVAQVIPQVQYQAVEPITTSIVRTPIINRYEQPIIGYNRVVSVDQPQFAVRQQISEPVIRVDYDRVQKGNDFIKYVETD
jgi:hypothetical protein